MSGGLTAARPYRRLAHEANNTSAAPRSTPTGTNPYTGAGGYFEGMSPARLLAVFPWSHLQLLKMELHG